jgi:hypothetical protein
MEPSGGAEVGFAPGKSKTGVATGSVDAGPAPPPGVEACSVANRSGVGEGAIGRLHPAKKKMRKIAKRDLNLFIQFD